MVLYHEDAKFATDPVTETTPVINKEHAEESEDFLDERGEECKNPGR